MSTAEEMLQVVTGTFPCGQHLKTSPYHVHGGGNAPGGDWYISLWTADAKVRIQENTGVHAVSEGA